MSETIQNKTTYNVKAFEVLERFCRRIYIWPECKLIFGHIHPLALLLTVQIMMIPLLVVHFFKCVTAARVNVILEDLLNIVWNFQVLQIQMTYLIHRKEFLMLLRMVDELKEHGIPVDQDKLTRNLIARMLWTVVPFTLSWMLGILAYYYPLIFTQKSIDAFACTDALYLLLAGKQHVLEKIFISFIFFFMLHGVLICFILLSTLIATADTLVFRMYSVNSFLSEIDFRKKESGRKLKMCILFYSDLARLNKISNLCWGRVEQFVNLGYAVTLSLAVLKILVSPMYKEAIYIFLCIAFAFVQHNLGQRLMDASNTLLETAYGTNWYKGDITVQKDLFIFMSLMQKPLRRAHGFLEEMSHNALSKFWSKLVSYLILLRNVYDSYE